MNEREWHTHTSTTQKKGKYLCTNGRNKILVFFFSSSFELKQWTKANNGKSIKLWFHFSLLPLAPFRQLLAAFNFSFVPSIDSYVCVCVRRSCSHNGRRDNKTAYVIAYQSTHSTRRVRSRHDCRCRLPLVLYCRRMLSLVHCIAYELVRKSQNGNLYAKFIKLVCDSMFYFHLLSFRSSVFRFFYFTVCVWAPACPGCLVSTSLNERNGNGWLQLKICNING